MSAISSHEVTQLLVAWGDGDQVAFENLVPLVHSELRRLAKRYMGRERAGHTLQTSALVNEAYVRLINWKNARFEDRSHFFGVSAHLMRRILIDFSRSRPHNAEGEIEHVTLDEALMISSERGSDLIALDDALNSLAQIDPRKSQIVEMKFFGGMSNEEIAQFLDIAPITVIREWNKSKAWLYRELNRRAEDEG